MYSQTKAKILLKIIDKYALINYKSALQKELVQFLIKIQLDTEKACKVFAKWNNDFLIQDEKDRKLEDARDIIEESKKTRMGED